MTPRSTEPTGWIVSVTEVSAAGSRGSETVISSQPRTCEVSASVTSQACSGQLGTRSAVAERESGRDRHDGGDGGRVEQRAGRAAQVAAALAQHEDEAGVGDAR